MKFAARDRGGGKGMCGKKELYSCNLPLLGYLILMPIVTDVTVIFKSMAINKMNSRNHGNLFYSHCHGIKKDTGFFE